jgi:hypothetical protein
MRWAKQFEFEGKYENNCDVNGNGYISMEGMQILIECNKALDVVLIFQLIYYFLKQIGYEKLNQIPFDIDGEVVSFEKEQKQWKNYVLRCYKHCTNVGEIYVSSAGRINRGLTGDLIVILNLLSHFELAGIPTGNFVLRMNDANVLRSINAIVSKFERSNIISYDELLRAKNALGFCDYGWEKAVELIPENTPITVQRLKDIAQKLKYEEHYHKVMEYLGLSEC